MKSQQLPGAAAGYCMSALGQKRTFALQQVISALPPIADMCGATRDVRFVPIADISSLVRHTDVLDVLLIDRLLRRSHFPFAEAPPDRNWMWTITALEKQPSIHNSGYSATREHAMADFRAQWLS